MAQGLNNSWGTRTEFDPNRGVQKQALAQRVAATSHYQHGLSAQEIQTMPDEQWSPLAGDSGLERDDVYQLMRAYEHYK